MHPSVLLIFAQLSVHLLPLVSSQIIYHIKPTQQSSCDIDSCYMLSEMANGTNRDKYFSRNITNITLVFLPGLHVLDTGVVLLEHKKSVAFFGDSNTAHNVTSTVVCNGSSGFVFKQIHRVQIERLTVTNCGSAEFPNTSYGAQQLYDNTYLPTFTMLSVQICFLGYSNMEHNYLALLANESIVYIYNSTFVGNKGSKGGAIQVVGGSSVVCDGTNLFRNNTAVSFGGGIYVASAKLYLRGNVQFHANFAVSGGGIASLDGGKVFFVQPSSDAVQTLFVGNSALMMGGSIALYKSYILQQSRHSLEFSNNIANDSGGAVFGYFSSFVWEGVLMFNNNTAVRKGGGVADIIMCVWNSTSTATFARNSVRSGKGGGINALFGKIFFSGATSFIQNRAVTGGGIQLFHCDIEFNTTAELTFFGNYAERSGGWLYMHTRHVSIFSRYVLLINNRAGIVGGAITITGPNFTMTFIGRGEFRNNSATLGGAVAIEDGSIRINGTYIYQNNSANHGGAIFSNNGYIHLQGNHTFTNNDARHKGYSGYGGGIKAHRTGITMEGNVSFSYNSASYGGGMAITDYYHAERRLLYLGSNTRLHFRNNHAYIHGGGILIEEAPFLYCTSYSHATLSLETPCFFQICHNECKPQNILLLANDFDNHNTWLIFEANTVGVSGNDIYGGMLDKCGVCTSWRKYLSGIDALRILVGRSLEQTPGKASNITSDPFQLCHCEGLVPNCSSSKLTKNVYPGETIHIAAVAIGQVNGTTPAVVHASFENLSEGSLGYLQSTQQVNTWCTQLMYTIKQKNSSEANLIVFVEGQCGELGYFVTILVKFLPCPSGFSLSPSGGCACQHKLQKFTNTCDIDSRTITRISNFWVGCNSHSCGLILHPHCPFDYCTLKTVSFTLNSTDLQCAHGRSGTLCGACKPGLSLNLGSSRCSSCSNSFVLLLLPFAAAGFLLVIFLFTCKLTVSAGTISGLIFYANVIAVNRSVFFPPGETNILTVFIAWLNLDLGIETCFFDGMDAYTRTWLQFVFPLYIWSLVGLVPLASHYSMAVARIIGPTNPVAVLATLFLLSYTKLLRTIIATFSFTTLDYPDDHKLPVWVYDGNIRFCEGKHAALFVAGLMAFLIVFLPYTLFLLCGQFIIARSNYRVLSWANKHVCKSFLDAYYAPYVSGYRYWTGLLLVLRFLLFIISAVVDINTPKDPSINLLLLVVMCIGLTIWIWNTGSMYKKWYCNALESSFILNLAILAAASYQVKVEGGSKQAVVYTSVGVAFLTFLGIIAYHVIERVRDTRVWKHSIMPVFINLKARVSEQEGNEDAIEMDTPSVPPPSKVTTTFVELREPLLESQN